MFILDTPGMVAVQVTKEVPYTHVKINPRFNNPDREPTAKDHPRAPASSGGAIGFPTIDVEVVIGVVSRGVFSRLGTFEHHIPHPAATAINRRSTAAGEDLELAREQGIFAHIISAGKLTSGTVI